MGRRITSLSIKSCTSWLRRKQLSAKKSSHPIEDYVVSEFKQVKKHEPILFVIFDGHLSHDIPDYLRSRLFVNILNEPDLWTEIEDNLCTYVEVKK
ncbi:putative protein phosphatase 2C 58, partial [Camellia lanceoleosa]